MGVKCVCIKAIGSPNSTPAHKKKTCDRSAVFIEDRLQTLLGVLDHPDPFVRERSDLLLAG